MVESYGRRNFLLNKEELAGTPNEVKVVKKHYLESIQKIDAFQTHSFTLNYFPDFFNSSSCNR